jgi:hypothetical protein
MAEQNVPTVGWKRRATEPNTTDVIAYLTRGRARMISGGENPDGRRNRRRDINLWAAGQGIAGIHAGQSVDVRG